MPPPTKGISYLFIEVSDVSRSLSFYTEVFGLEVIVASPPAFAFVKFAGTSGPRIGLYPKQSEGHPSSEGRLLAIDVDELNEWEAFLDSKGIVASSQEDVPGGTVIKFDDPDGNHLELHKPR